jgi:hypothetical protein
MQNQYKKNLDEKGIKKPTAFVTASQHTLRGGVARPTH